LRSLRPLRFDFLPMSFFIRSAIRDTSPSVARDFPLGRRYQANLQSPRHQSDPGSVTFHPPETMVIIVFVAFENGICPQPTHKSHKVCYGTYVFHVLMFSWYQLFGRSCSKALRTNN
jgi:hypothetical protein